MQNWVLRFARVGSRCEGLLGPRRWALRYCLSIPAFSILFGLSGAAQGGLVGHWRLDEGSGAVTAVDSSPWGRDGTYHGSPDLDVGGLAGTAGTLCFDDFHLVGTKARCLREALVGADSNGDCRVDFRDFSALAGNWLADVD
ncbi:MAG: hypothetical protein KAY65_14400 [Planctomycetes bacterium]|nr:hypothetical protein [Planctomycetota bacterium]